MAEGGTKKARIEALDKELNEELAQWSQMRVNPGQSWRMGDMEFHIRCEILALMELLKDKLGVDQEDFDIHFKQVVLNELRKFRPQIEQAQAEARRRAIVDGVNPIVPRPPIDPRSN